MKFDTKHVGFILAVSFFIFFVIITGLQFLFQLFLRADNTVGNIFRILNMSFFPFFFGIILEKFLFKGAYTISRIFLTLFAAVVLVLIGIFTIVTGVLWIIDFFSLSRTLIIDRSILYFPFVLTGHAFIISILSTVGLWLIRYLRIFFKMR